MSGSPAASDGKSYDLYLKAGEGRVVWSYADHGVTLSDDAIAWVADGRPSQVHLGDIVAVHLRLSYIEDNAIGGCRLTFADGSGLSIVSGNKRGFGDAAQDRLYVEFIEDLHARLARHRNAGATFTAGFSDTRYHFGLVVSVIAALFFVVLPVALLLTLHDWHLALITYAGFALVWPLYKAMQANVPRSYDPHHVPPELMPARLNLPPKIDPVLFDSSN